MLYIIATPIGNLSDITFRAIEILRTCDFILCEDTRHSRILLQHYQIQKPLQSFHQFNESAKQDKVLEQLQKGDKIALISDAGTPGISDPGEQLIQACIEKNISVVAIPGPCAAIAGLCCSGLKTDRFEFRGFLPRKAGELRRTLQDILTYTATTICYESPHRLKNVLECIHELAPARPLVVARELTKKFEEICRGTAQELLQHWKDAPLKGEIVLMFSGNQENPDDQWQHLTPQQHIELMESTYGLSRKEAIALVAKLRGLKKNTIYKESLKAEG